MNDDVLHRLERLAKLKEQGAITDAEFNKQKAELMGNGPRPVPEKKPVGCFKILAYVFGGMLILGAIGALLEEKKDGSGLTVISDSAAAANARAQKMNNDIGLAPYKARRAIKKNLKDPDSFEEIDHRAGFVGEKGIYISCLTTYRAKNSFGGYGIEKALVNFNDAMEPFEVVPVDQ